MLRVVALLLIAEGVWTLMWLTQLLSSLGWRDKSSVALILARRRSSALPLARWVLLVSAVLFTLEIGWRLTPTDLDPTYRWPLVLAYWVYAVVAFLFVRRALLSLQH